MLEDVEAQDRVEEAVDGVRITLDDRDRFATSPEHGGQLGIRLERDDRVGELGEARGVGADPGADVENAPVQPRPRSLDQPGVVRVRGRHGIEVMGKRLGHPWEDRETLRICVLTTSYPRASGDAAGSFVAEQVEHLRAAGVEVDGRLAGDLPALRDRLRRRDRPEPARPAVARSRSLSSFTVLPAAHGEPLAMPISSMRTGFRRVSRPL